MSTLHVFLKIIARKSYTLGIAAVAYYNVSVGEPVELVVCRWGWWRRRLLFLFVFLLFALCSLPFPVQAVQQAGGEGRARLFGHVDGWEREASGTRASSTRGEDIFLV